MIQLSNLTFLLSPQPAKKKIMARSRWLCTNSTRNMLVKIVHPGGHVELHDRPVLAAEIMLRNPRCCIAYPHVFQQPWAIVAPDTMLMLGQKFYVVPISTIRKLQRLSFKFSPSASPFASPLPSPNTKAKPQDVTKEEDQMDSTCWSKMEKDECLSRDGCFVCLFKGTKLKANPEGATEDSRSSSSFGSSETREFTGRKRSKDITRTGMRGSPKRLASYDNWQPRLESITEE
ncbi:hypothetical protein BT93_A0389 [Corymbia citriodora subsp. variegata]|nr:hypothetical protein BT93_A0389 [Corymbia citriodora subsp. variegata]